MTIGRLLSSSFRKDIIEIKKSGHSRVSVHFKNYDTANNLINNPILKLKKLTAFIPISRTYRNGIIRGVPLELSEEEIKEGIQSPYTITSIRRLNRRSSSEDYPPKYSPSKTILISFKEQSLPKYIFFYMVRHEVSPFVTKTTLCFSCLRYGHHMSQCKGYPRCSHCGDKDHSKDICCPSKDLPPRCVNCKGQHKSTDKSCPEYNTQIKIRELAAYRNI